MHDLVERVKALGIENRTRPSCRVVLGKYGPYGNGEANAWASYRNVLQGDRSPALTRELCKPEVFCVYGPASGGKPMYQWVHSRNGDRPNLSRDFGPGS